MHRQDGFGIKVHNQWNGFGLDDLSVLREFLKFSADFFELSSTRSRVEGLTVLLTDTPAADGLCGDFTFQAALGHGLLRLYDPAIEGARDLDEILTVASHEMIHCKQWAFSELQWSTLPSGAGTLLWMDTPNVIDQEFKDYRNSPWEREAFDNQAHLLSMYQRRVLASLEDC